MKSKEAFRFFGGKFVDVFDEPPPMDAPSTIAFKPMVVVSSDAWDDPASDSFRGRSVVTAAATAESCDAFRFLLGRTGAAAAVVVDIVTDRVANLERIA